MTTKKANDMDALDQFQQKVRHDPDLSNPHYLRDTENPCLHWGELIFELDFYQNMINVYLDDFDELIGVYGYEQAYEVLEGHQRMFK